MKLKFIEIPRWPSIVITRVSCAGGLGFNSRAVS